MATLKDIAQETGFSPSTVSIVLRGIGNGRSISQETQDTILAAARRLRYSPNVSARRLRNNAGKKNIIAVYIASDFRATIISRFFRGLENYISETNADLEIAICPYVPGKLCNSASLEILNMYAGIIIGMATPADIQYIESLNLISPVVFYNRKSKKFSYVGVDNEGIGASVAKKFIQDGCREGIVLSCRGLFQHYDLRAKGFAGCFSEAGLSCRLEYTDMSNIKEGRAFGQAFSCQRKTGIFPVTDELAMGLLTELSDRGVDIPNDVEIITAGTQDLGIYECLRPSLAVIDIPLEEIAYQGASILNASIKDGIYDRTVINVPYKFNYGNSVLNR